MNTSDDVRISSSMHYQPPTQEQRTTDEALKNMAQDMSAEELQKQKDLQEQQLRQRAEALHDPELIPLAHQSGGDPMKLRDLLSAHAIGQGRGLPPQFQAPCSQAAAYLLLGMASPMLIMQQIEQLQQSMALAEKKIANECAQFMVKQREQNRQLAVDAAKLDFDSSIKKACTVLGTSVGGVVLAQGAHFMRARQKIPALDKKIADARERGEKETVKKLLQAKDSASTSRLGTAIQQISTVSSDSIGDAVVANQVKSAALMRANAELGRSLVEQTLKAIDQHESESNQLRRRAAETVITAVTQNAQTQQSVSFRL